MEELAPCPFCNDSERLQVIDCMTNFFVDCDNCGSVGPEKTTREEAIKAWNTRNGVTYKKATEPSGVDNGGDVIWFGKNSGEVIGDYDE